MAFWYDGQAFGQDTEDPIVQARLPAQVPLDNIGLRFGATVFTTMRVYGDSLQHPLTQWQAHCDRLAQSISHFNWIAPHWPTVYQGCHTLKSTYPLLRVTIFPDGREWITGRSLPTQRMETSVKGIACWVAPPNYARSLPTHKTGNYLACWLARQQAQTLGTHEAILTSEQGEWLETSTGNLWGWKRGNGLAENGTENVEAGGWYTPHSARCLSGVMRSTLEKILQESGQPVHRQPWSPKRLLSFETIAYSNCAVGLLPIHTIVNGTTKLEYNPNHASLKALQHQLGLLSSPAK